MILMVNEFKNLKNIDCEIDNQLLCIENGNDWLRRYSFKSVTVQKPIRNLILLVFGYHLIAFLAQKISHFLFFPQYHYLSIKKLI